MSKAHKKESSSDLKGAALVQSTYNLQPHSHSNQTKKERKKEHPPNQAQKLIGKRLTDRQTDIWTTENHKKREATQSKINNTKE